MDKQQYRSHVIAVLAATVEDPEKRADDLLGISTVKSFSKGQRFIDAGEVPEHVGINLAGIFRLFYVNRDGCDFTKGFSTPGKLVISYSALARKRASFFSIEAITPAEILQFRYRDFVELVGKDPGWYPFLFRNLEAVYIMKEMREKAFLLDDATTRYLDFRQQYAGHESRIRQYHVASFLGITPESLSRIKRKLKVQGLLP